MGRLRCTFLVALIFVFFTFPYQTQAQVKKVRVTIEDATIWSKPDLASEVLQKNVPLGAVFEVQKKVEEWYEVKFIGKLGIPISGYISALSVEEVIEEIEEREERKEREEKEVPKPEREIEREKAGRKMDFAFSAGKASGSFLSDSSAYLSSWGDWNLLKTATDLDMITHKLKSPLGAGISFSYFLWRGLGVQFRVDYNFTKKFIPAESISSYQLTWSWTSGVSGSREKSWETRGEFSLVPLSVNLIYKVEGGKFAPYANAGVSYSLARIRADSTCGYSTSWSSGNTQYIDFLAIPIKIDKSLNSVGFNLGGGLDIFFLSNVALFAEANYFIGKKFKENWEAFPGSYKAVNFQNFSLSFSQNDADYLREQISPLEIDLSFFIFQAGMRFLF